MSFKDQQKINISWMTQFLLPGIIRLSIHNKPLNYKQFFIKCSPNLHRQPSHGTIGLRLRKDKTHCHLKFDKYISIFIKKESTTNDHLSILARIDQPIVWIHPDLAQLYITNDNNLRKIFVKDKKIR